MFGKHLQFLNLSLTILFCVRVGTSRITVAPACEQRCFFSFFLFFPRFPG